MKLSGKVAVLTGAARGIGRAIAEAYAKEGAELLLVDSLSAVEQTAQEIGQGQPQSRVKAYSLDLRKTEKLEQLAQYAFDDFGTVDILVNNAGVCKRGFIADLKEEEWDWHFDINVKAMFFLTKSVVRRMIERGVKGRIVNTASIMAKIGEAGFAAYTSSKHAILGFCRCLAFEMAPHGIRVNALCPGIVDTEMERQIDAQMAREQSKSPAEVRKQYESLIPLGRYAQPKDIARAALFLASEDSDYLTGQAINVCGGMVMY
jgi:meso-butanediol dehydrogenase/(S,S)-butanediol dehydrogenase/diacetyl reductase